ncbi:hypothetical protein SECTIM467_88 [Brevibacillus phage SecTim467]|uniref:Uncharacterized protein n=2 Tax=Jenstvirus jenst TaxID=1982225 RepID=A0A0K2CP23_9CAUD|nr:hypothetical protein AVV11_gp108 [Brevibacillus phage Jenst]ALA07212.1 hypothetical protein JENST_83 [Brevibacillus phage Jenst]ALA07577.1 hypothetical protein SECTIM467_88 [Brevibacillus phage SecTim467]
MAKDDLELERSVRVATYVYTLGVVVEEVGRIEEAIRNIEQTMHHVSPAAVEVLRRNKVQLEQVLERIMDADVTSNLSLQNLLIGHKACLQDCFTVIYTNKSGHIERTRGYQ